MKHLLQRIALIAAIVCLSGAAAFAQQVSGTVKDVSGNPVIGAAVMVDGTSIGTTSDLDGNFTLPSAPPRRGSHRFFHWLCYNAGCPERKGCS